MKLHLNFTILICSLLWLPKINAEDVQDPTRDLMDEYYTTISAATKEYIEQDSIDAQAIWDAGNGQSDWFYNLADLDSDKSKKVMASIFLYREKKRRYAINDKILEKVDAIPGSRRERKTWITESHSPQWEGYFTPFLDLCFCLIEDENVVLSAYLQNYFNRKDETWIVILMVLTKDMGQMIRTYDEWTYQGCFKTNRKYQRKPFENMLRVWVRYNREPIEKDKLDEESTTKDANALKAEQNDGCWKEKRDQIELILMKKSITYARAVIQKFEKSNKDSTIDSIINSCSHDHGLNHDLADAYSSLARYIKDKHSYVASILHDYSDGSQWWAAWIVSIAVIHTQEWSKVDAAFQKRYQDEATSLSDFILKKLAQDKIMAEAIAVIIDPKFKPTEFQERPVQ